MLLTSLAALRAGDVPVATPVTLSVDPTHVIRQIDERIYSHFLEHIYHSANGGLWGDVVWNRSFEELPPLEKGEKRATNAFARHWEIIGNESVRLDTNQPLNALKSVRISATDAPAGVAQKNFCLHAGDTLRGSLWARGRGTLVVRLGGQEKTLPALAADWKEYPLEFTPVADDSAATLEIVTRGHADVNVDQVSLMADSARATGGFRPDLLAAVTDLHPPIIRWPGGGFVNGYNWKNGIGPQSKRLDKGRRIWDELDPSSFGIDEFITLCRKVGAQPLICVNITTSPALPNPVQDACDFIEYCNGSATSKWGAIRAANGHPEPYNVKQWEIGNEAWNLGASNYVKIVREFAPAMKKMDPSIQLSACGSGGVNPEGRGQAWNAQVLDACSDCFDFLSIHIYQNPESYAKGPENFSKFWRDAGKLIAASKNPRIKLFVSEWNAQCIDWRTGLYCANMLNHFEEASDLVAMATPALWLRHVSAEKWNNAFINFDNCSWFPAPNYVVMKLWREHFAPNLLAIEGNPGLLNIVATKGDNLIVKAVNPGTNAVPVVLKVTSSETLGTADFALVNPGSLTALNSLAQPHLIQPAPAPVAVEGRTVRFTLPPISAGVVTVKLGR